MARVFTNRYLGIGLLMLGLVGWYIATPLWLTYTAAPDAYLVKLAGMTALAIGAMAVGFSLPWLDKRFAPDAPRWQIPEQAVQAVVWGTFILFAVVVVATAKSIPLLSSLQGASEVQLSVERGDFLKTRTGWQALLVYISALYVGAFLPYATARLFIYRHPSRFVAVSIFLLYTLLALEKATFIFVLGPLLWLSFKRANYKAAGYLVVLCAATMYVNTVLARGDLKAERLTTASIGNKASPAQADYFSIHYRRKSAVDHIFWRAIVIPVVTARDALLVFEERFAGRHLWGATSSFVAKVTGQERVNYDAEVFAYQYGRSDIGASNAVYIIEAFVNFGWLGVVAFSLFIGQALRWFSETTDEAIHVMWPLFCFFIFNAGVIGTLLSNG